MKRRQFLCAFLGLPALLAALAAGCGSGKGTAPIGGAFSTGGTGSSGGGNGSGTNGTGRGAAEGFVFLNESNTPVLLPTAAAGTSSGFVPASGLRAEVIDGGPSSTVGADGLLRLNNIAPGLRKLRISSGSGASAAVLLEISLTVVPGAVLPLGTPTVSRAAAVQAVLTQLGGINALGGADVLAASTPLPAGVTVSLAVQPGEGETTLVQPSWFVYVDKMPVARFGHDTVLALVDAETGAVSIQEADSWPLLNGATFYGLAEVNATSPDAVHVASRATSVPLAPAAPVALPPTESAHRAALSGTCRAADPDGAKTHYLIVQGDQRSDFGADPPTIMNFLQTGPFPPVGQMQFVKTFEEAVEPGVAIVNAFNTVRDAAKSGDTLVLFVTTHGHLSHASKDSPEQRYSISCELGQNVPAQNTLADGTKYETKYVDIRQLDFSPCKACRIILLIDTCYSGNWIPILRPQLDALSRPRDLLVFTSADQLHPAEGLEKDENIKIGGKTTFVALGGLFTQSLLAAARGQKNALTKNAVSTDLLAASFDFAYALTDAHNQVFIQNLHFPQNPQRYVRSLDPDEVCGKGNQKVSVQ